MLLRNIFCQHSLKWPLLLLLTVCASCGKSETEPDASKPSEPVPASATATSTPDHTNATNPSAVSQTNLPDQTEAPVETQQPGVVETNVSGTGPLVAIEWQTAEKLNSSVGIVIGQQNGLAYVVSNSNSGSTGPYAPLSPNSKDDTFKFIWSDEETHEVPAKLIASFAKKMWVFVAPQEQMPAPWNGSANREDSFYLDMPIRIVAFESQREKNKSRFNTSFHGAKISRIDTLNPVDTRFIIASMPTENIRGMCLCLDSRNVFLGMTTSINPSKLDPETSTMQLIQRNLFDLCQEYELPDLGYVYIDRLDKSDTFPKKYQIVVRIDDPLRRLNPDSELQLLVTEVKNPGHDLPCPPKQIAPYEALEDSRATPIQSDPVDELILDRMIHEHACAEDTFCFADYEVREKADHSQNLFHVQLVMKDPSGQQVYGRPLQVRYEPSSYVKRAERIVETISLPKLYPEGDGEVRLTSKDTQVDIPPTVSRDWPQPQSEPTDQQQGRGATEEEARGLEGFVWDFPEPVPNWHPNRWSTYGAFSLDDSALFFVDNKNILRKLSTSDLSCQAVLDLKSECAQVTISQAGLVLLMTKLKCIWVVNPESLEIVRQISLDGAESLCANPTTSIGLCRGFRKESPSNSSSSLFMMDFESGTILHQIRLSIRKSRTEDLKLSTPHGEIPLVKRTRLLQMSPDGTHLYTAGSPGIAHFRVADQDLIFTGATPDKQATIFDAWNVSSDGQWLVAPAAANGGLFFYSADHLNEPQRKFTFDAFQPLEFTQAQQKSSAWLFKQLQLRLFSLEDEKTASFELPELIKTVFSNASNRAFGIITSKKLIFVKLPEKSRN